MSGSCPVAFDHRWMFDQLDHLEFDSSQTIHVWNIVTYDPNVSHYSSPCRMDVLGLIEFVRPASTQVPRAALCTAGEAASGAHRRAATPGGRAAMASQPSRGKRSEEIPTSDVWSRFQQQGDRCTSLVFMDYAAKDVVEEPENSCLLMFFFLDDVISKG